jgi:hypothetical protein
MITNDPGIKQNKTFLIKDSDIVSGQNTTLTAAKSFQEVMSELLGGNETNKRNQSSLDLKDCYADLKASPSAAKKTSAGDAVKLEKKVESAVRWLANYLGVKPSFLLAVFNELDINPNDMADQSKFLDIINELAEHFNLNDKQKKEMTEKMGAILGFSF